MKYIITSFILIIVLSLQTDLLAQCDQNLNIEFKTCEDRPIRAVGLTIENQNYVTDSLGFISIPLSDFNISNGKLNIEFEEYYQSYFDGMSTLDIVMIQQHILRHIPFDSKKLFLRADMDNDGRVGMLDLSHMRRLILGSSEYFPWSTSIYFSENTNRVITEIEISDCRVVGENDITISILKRGDVNCSIE